MRSMSKLLSSLKNKFKIREMGEPRHFLGMTVKYFQDQGVIALNQSKYIHKLQQTFLQSNAYSRAKPTTPIVSDYYKSLETAIPVVDTLLRSLVGGLIFVAISTRPELSFAVSVLTQAFSSPIC